MENDLGFTSETYNRACKDYGKDYVDKLISDGNVRITNLLDKDSNIIGIVLIYTFNIEDSKYMRIKDYNISQLKSKIKHSKNHMERIRLEKELSKLYVKRKLKSS